MRRQQHKNKQKREGNPSFSRVNSVPLKTPGSEKGEKIGSTFLGYKLKNVNQLWTWPDLLDVEIK